MNLNTTDMIKTKLLDAQENVRDFQEYSGKVDDREVSNAFREFAEESAMQARRLQQLLSKHEETR